MYLSRFAREFFYSIQIQKLNKLFLIPLLLLPFASAYATPTIDFEKCANNPDHHCYSYLPEENTGPQINPSWSFDSLLPDGTCNIHGFILNVGGCSLPPLTESNDNWTRTKQNPAIMSITNIHTLSVNATTNYCPFGLYTLTHQDGYLIKLYDNSKSLDLTGYVYPAFCHIETGPNPIDGDSSISSIPEFPTIPLVLLSCFIMVIFFTKKYTLSLGKSF